jgi:hypothetical protein
LIGFFWDRLLFINQKEWVGREWSNRNVNTSFCDVSIKARRMALNFLFGILLCVLFCHHLLHTPHANACSSQIKSSNRSTHHPSIKEADRERSNNCNTVATFIPQLPQPLFASQGRSAISICSSVYRNEIIRACLFFLKQKSQPKPSSHHKNHRSNRSRQLFLLPLPPVNNCILR